MALYTCDTCAIAGDRASRGVHLLVRTPSELLAQESLGGEAATPMRFGRLNLRSWWLPALASSSILLLVTLVLLAPALSHGSMLGPYDYEQNWGLGAVSGTLIHNTGTKDQIRELIPWTVVNWLDIHHGHLPIWNPYDGLGLPQMFNFQSASFSLPMLVAFIFPLRLAFDVVIIMQFLIAGTGVLFLCRRVLGLDWISATFAGFVAELSGAFTGWAGWPMTGVFCWMGWVLGAALLIVQDSHRFRWTLLLAISVAFAIYGGHPESYVLMALAAFFPLVLVTVHEARERGLRAVGRRIGFLAGGLIGGVGLAAPLLLPGAGLLANSSHTKHGLYQTLPWLDSINVMLSNYYGNTLTGNTIFGPRIVGERGPASVGVIVLILAVLAIAVLWRQRIVMGLGLSMIVFVAFIYLSPLGHLTAQLPVIKLIEWNRLLIPLDFFLAVLAAIGLNILLTRSEGRTPLRWFLGIALAATIFVAVAPVTLFAVKATSASDRIIASIQDRSIEWGAAEALIALGVAVALLFQSTRRLATSETAQRRTGSMRMVAVTVLTLSELAFLLYSTPNLWSSSNTGLTLTAAETTLKQEASGLRVGFGSCISLTVFDDLGILTETNMIDQVDEFGIYDPILPNNLVSSYKALVNNKQPAGLLPGNFCPAITNASVARHYGVSLVLERTGAAGPPGSVPDGSIGGEGLFSVPGSGIVTIEPIGTPADSATAVRVPTSSKSPSDFQFVTDATTKSTVYIHIGNFPGWHATIDGRPLRVRKWASIEMAVDVPPGKHTVSLNYDPRSFQIGVVVSLVAALCLLGGIVVVIVRRRRRIGAAVASETA